MKNNTKVRLHLSKQLFESLAKQVLAEAKKGDMSGGAYTEAVKAPKGEKKEKAHKAEEPKEKDVKSEANSAPAAKDASKQQVGTDLVNKGRNLAKDPKANIQSAEGGRLLDIISNLINLSDDPNNSSMVLDKVSRLLAQNQPKAAGLEEMETMTAESEVNPMHYVNDPTLQFITQVLTSGLLGTMAATIIKGIVDDVKKGKKTSAQAAKEAADVIKTNK